MSTFFFITSKIIWGFVRPESWFVIALAWGCLLLVRQKIPGARRVLALTLVAAVTIGVFPLGELLIRPLETRYPANPVIAVPDGIIVLGGAENARQTAYWHQIQLNGAAERFTTALALARRFPNAKIVFTGGSGSLRDALGKGPGGAEVAKQFFLAAGIPSSRLVLESRARNTAENAGLTYALVRPKPAQTWLLVTSAFHLPRAMRSFRRAGWRHITPVPVDYRSGRIADDIGWDLVRNLRTLDIAVKEYIGLLAYSLSGR